MTDTRSRGTPSGATSGGVRRESDADAAEALAARRAAYHAHDALALTGAEVRTLRSAFAKADKALRRINPKGLVTAHRTELGEARAELAAAQRLIAAGRDQGGRDQGGRDQDSAGLPQAG